MARDAVEQASRVHQLEHKLAHIQARREEILSENEGLKRDVDLCARYVDDKERLEREIMKENK
jgi:hypothetical protein